MLLHSEVSHKFLRLAVAVECRYQVRCEVLGAPPKSGVIGARGVWLRLGLRAPQTLACQPRRGCLPPVAAHAGGGGKTSCSSRNGSRPLLARSAMQGGGRAIFASYSKPPRRNRRRRATRSRRPDCPRRECVPPRRDTLRDSADGTRLEGCGSAARLALVAEASPSKSRAWLHPQLSR